MQYDQANNFSPTINTVYQVNVFSSAFCCDCDFTGNIFTIDGESDVFNSIDSFGFLTETGCNADCVDTISCPSSCSENQYVVYNDEYTNTLYCLTSENTATNPLTVTLKAPVGHQIYSFTWLDDFKYSFTKTDTRT